MRRQRVAGGIHYFWTGTIAAALWLCVSPSWASAADPSAVARPDALATGVRRLGNAHLLAQ